MNSENDEGAMQSDSTRELRKTEGTEITTTVPLPTAYEERAVAFLDIMGWRELINQSHVDTSQLSKMGSALTYLKLICELPRSVEDWLRSKSETAGQVFDPADGRLQFAQFSDSIIISGSASMFFPLVFQVWGINRALFFSHGLLLRGAISIGPMYHRGSVAFGPALTAAYDLEQKSAIYPRVIFDPKILTPSTSDLTDPKASSSPFANWFRLSSDNLWFFDYLNPLTSISPSVDDEHTRSAMIESFVVPNLNYAKKLISDALTKHSACPRVWEKYRWVAEYFNIVNSEYPAANVAPIAASCFAPR